MNFVCNAGSLCSDLGKAGPTWRCRNLAQSPGRVLSMCSGPQAELLSNPRHKGHRQLTRTPAELTGTRIPVGKGPQHSRCIIQLFSFLEPMCPCQNSQCFESPSNQCPPVSLLCFCPMDRCPGTCTPNICSSPCGP